MKSNPLDPICDGSPIRTRKCSTVLWHLNCCYATKLGVRPVQDGGRISRRPAANRVSSLYMISMPNSTTQASFSFMKCSSLQVSGDRVHVIWARLSIGSMWRHSVYRRHFCVRVTAARPVSHSSHNYQRKINETLPDGSQGYNMPGICCAVTTVVRKNPNYNFIRSQRG